MRQCFEYHPVLGYRFIPELTARILHEGGGYRFRTNPQGFRCRHDFDAPRTPGRRRILLFGDSFTAGDGVSDGLRYGDLLEGLVGDTDIFNFGMPGTGTDQQYLAFREFCSSMEYDGLVLAPMVENIQRLTAHYRENYDEDGILRLYPKPYFECPDSSLCLRNSPPGRHPVDRKTLSESERRFVYRGAARGAFPRLTRLLRRHPSLESAARHVACRSVWPQYDAPSTPGWQLMSALLRQWISDARAPVLLMPIPDYIYIEGHDRPDAYVRRFRELAIDVGCAFHDPLPDFLRYSLSKRRAMRFPRDGHYSPIGHSVLAHSLARPFADALLSVGAQH